LFCTTAQGKTIFYVFLGAAVLKKGFTFFFEVISRDLKAIPVFEFRNVHTATLLLQANHLLSILYSIVRILSNNGDKKIYARKPFIASTAP
ncbi:MAG: hypothetical protein U1C55_01010, partial [Smithellaceae bacterium]|nr:hypothetical protein [Smithellaceae bacterium]